MAKRKLATRMQVITEIERAYEELTAPNSDWDLDDKQWWDMRLKLLASALQAADDSDVMQRIVALQEKLDAIESGKPRATVTPIRPGAAG